MKFNAGIFFLVLGFYLISLTKAFSTTQAEIVQHTDSLEPDKDGFWSEKKTWKSRWVKYWQPKKIYIPIWKKVWSPLIQKEWVPLPNSPPGWHEDNGKTNIQEVY